MTILRTLEMLDRAHNGPICAVKEWNTRVIPTNVARKLKEHGLNGTCDRENPINTDDELADRFYQAGFELAVELGVLCQNTERIIKVDADELRRALKDTPSQLFLGKGPDEILLQHRQPEDTILARGSVPTGVMMGEDIYTKFIEACVQYGEVDVLAGATISTILGRPALARTPYETLTGWYEAQLSKEALTRAGRRGLCKIGIISSPTEYAQLGGFGTSDGGLDPEKDLAIVLVPGELTTSYEVFHKVIHANICGGRVLMNYASMIGGYPGSIEGTVLCYIAMGLLSFAVHPTTHLTGIDMVDLRYLGNSGREGMWVHSVAIQAAARNTHYLTWHMLDQVGGPGTEMLLYEDAVTMLMYTASGGCGVFTTRTSGTRHAEYITPLECKFCCELLHCSSGMTRKQVNEIVKKLIPKYENLLRDPPQGNSFRELYDLETLKPKKEYLDLYLRIRRSLLIWVVRRRKRSCIGWASNRTNLSIARTTYAWMVRCAC